ncbi:MAG: hypothetical protein Q8N23_35155 [Archangium sp.]|nr:hypothetical protein [Archangium sp.]MDP3574909.1 hypothetical protein [Archangium sp.]
MLRTLLLVAMTCSLPALSNPSIVDLSASDLTGQDLQSDGTTSWVFATEGNDEVLFRTDGTTSGTVRVRSFPPVGNSRAPVGVCGLGPGVAFVQNGTGNLELTDGGPFLNLGLPPGRLLKAGRAAQGRSFFLVLLNSTAPFQLYVSDQTVAGTQLVSGVSVARTASNPTAIVGTQLYFVSDLGDVGVTDGVTTRLFFPREPSRLARSVYGCGDSVYIVSQESGQTTVHASVPPAPPVLLAPRGTLSLQGLSCTAEGALFGGATGGQGTELWRTDGTAAGTAIVHDLNPGAGSGLPFTRLVPHPDGGVHFVATDGPSGLQVWFSELQDGGAVQLSSGSSAPDLLEANVGAWAFYRVGAEHFMATATQVVSLDFAVRTAGVSGWKSSTPRPVAVGTRLLSFGSRVVPYRRDQLWVFDTALPFPIDDGGVRDAGMADAGRPDAGVPDAGVPDAGVPDAGTPDAGVPDAGVPDAGMPDAGMPDAGMPDAGMADAGMPDAGMADAGMPDAGSTDAGARDAGAPDAGASPSDAGLGEPAPGRGCGCDAAPTLLPLAWALFATRRRQRR